MGLILELALVSKGIAALGLILAGLGGSVSLSTPRPSIAGGYVAVSCAVQKGLCDDLRRMVDSGTPVTLQFACKLIRSPGHHEIARVAARRTVTYDVSDGTYRTVLTSPDTSWQVTSTSFDDASPFFRLDTTRLCQLDALQDDAVYSILIESYLDPIRVQAMGGKEFNLMSFWDFKRLGASSSDFRKGGEM